MGASAGGGSGSAAGSPDAKGANRGSGKSSPKKGARKKPRQPRKYDKKKRNKDGSTTYTFKKKNGKTVQVTYNKKGYPDFSKHKYQGPPGKGQVNIKLTGSRSKDFSAANKAAGFSKTPKGYTWHHHENKGVMQLVKTDVHSIAPHTGGFAG